MSRINPLDHNPIIYNDISPIDLIYQKNISIPQALHNQDQSINPYMWSATSCNMRKSDIPIRQFINAGERLVSNPEPVFPTSRLPIREQRLVLFDKNKQNHK